MWSRIVIAPRLRSPESWAKLATCAVFVLALLANHYEKGTAGTRVNTTVGKENESARESILERSLPPPRPEEIAAGQKAIPGSLRIPPEWVPLLNRAYPEFWAEGNHMPDAGLIIFGRNPTKDNAKLWLLRMEVKAKVLEEIFPVVQQAQQELVAQGLLKDRFHQAQQTGPEKSWLAKVVSKVTKPLSPATKTTQSVSHLKNLAFYFLFSPTCPHCERLATSLVGFPNVRPIQVTGSEPLRHWPGLPRSEQGTSETIANYVSGEVPLLLIFDSKTKRMLRLAGYRSVEQILAAAAQLGRK